MHSLQNGFCMHLNLKTPIFNLSLDIGSRSTNPTKMVSGHLVLNDVCRMTTRKLNITWYGTELENNFRTFFLEQPPLHICVGYRYMDCRTK